MPLRGSASCSAFDVSTRKVPSLALVPRGHLKHAARAKKKVAGRLQPDPRGNDPAKQRGELVHGNHHTDNDIAQRKQSLPSLSPPRPTRRQTLSDSLDEDAEEQEEAAAGRQKDPQQIKEDEEEEHEEEEEHAFNADDGQAELRLGERFLNVMALMARLSTQSLGENPAPSSPSPGRLARTNTERSMSLVRSNTLASIAAAPIAPPPPQSPSAQLPLPSPVKSPQKSPKRAVREVSKRLPRALQGPLTFDICMLLPTPLDERQSPLRSPIRRKRLRKRLRRRKLRRRARRTWHASHASWPPHASADYIVDHSRQDIAGISAARLVERLGERKVNNTQTLPRVISMPLPPLRQAKPSVQGTRPRSEAASDVDEQESDTHDSEDELELDEEGEGADDDTQDEEDAETPPPSSDCTENPTATSSPQDEVDDDDDDDGAAATSEPKTRPLYHQPAWISPELHAWLVQSGLFATKPRHELLPSEL